MTTIETSGVSPELLTAMNPKKKTATATEASQDRFMTLLVTQMKNQDPMNPLDNAQVTSQLAQLSTVTGIDKLNTTLEALKGSYQSGQTLQAAGMIGHGVLAPGSSMNLANGKAVFGIELTEPADSVKVKVFDSSGKMVHQMDLGGKEAGMFPLQWDGVTDSGDAAADGKYTFQVAAKRGDSAVGATSLAAGQVLSVTTGTQGVKLTVPDLGEINLADIRQIL